MSRRSRPDDAVGRHRVSPAPFLRFGVGAPVRCLRFRILVQVVELTLDASGVGLADLFRVQLKCLVPRRPGVAALSER
jgi:hypothetical protein